MRAPATIRIVLAIVGLAAAGLPGTPAWAQAVPLDARAPELTREELTRLLGELEQAASATGYSRELRNQAAREAAYVRERLEDGDFRVGDRVVLEVRGEPQLSDTLTVTGQRALELPEIGPVSLRGVLRSELEAHLTTELGRYLREPDLRAQSLIRIAVLGAVSAPGFYTMPASILLEDAIMAAGGPADLADVENVSIQRGDVVLWDSDVLQQAMREGRTLDQLNLQAGDRIMVPERRAGFFEGGILRTLLVTVPPLVYLIIRVME